MPSTKESSTAVLSAGNARNVEGRVQAGAWGWSRSGTFLEVAVILGGAFVGHCGGGGEEPVQKSDYG